MSNYTLTPKFYSNPGVPPKPPVEKYLPPQKQNEDPMQKLRSANTASGAAGLAAARTASSFVLAGGVCAFVASMAVWWLLLAAMLDTMEFPITIPRGDLSRWIKPRQVGRDEPRVVLPGNTMTSL
ncbi:hypothetical protein OOU_Y34scaffold00163g20 [Pyricularia oryzae Y34]|uniref:Transmembrane protein n=1 Tax=Pyricularia oryzae (strain Y34) TaxID=1143189 RepID=A0AA97PQI2_PYRO3|nr:hypothetical protein OOU_Y34scaffold00163g20 [Pyricularia oryzae Y34]